MPKLSRELSTQTESTRGKVPSCWDLLQASQVLRGEEWKAVGLGDSVQ